MSITINKICKWGNFSAMDFLFINRKSSQGLKERKFVFIMLLGLFALPSLPPNSKLPAQSVAFITVSQNLTLNKLAEYVHTS